MSTMDNNTDLGFYSRRVAKKVGLSAAVIYAHICYWIRKNKANERHFYNGKYWTYSSIKAFACYFPELTEKQVRTALDKLIQANLIETANFNKTGYDRTLWYSLTEKDESSQIDVPKNELPFALEGSPIPDNKQNNKQSIKKENIKKKEDSETSPESENDTVETTPKAKEISEAEKQAAEIYKLYPRKAARPTAIKAILKALKAVGYTYLYTQTQKYAEAVKESQKEASYIPYPATWFNREEYNDDWSGLKSPKPKYQGRFRQNDRTRYDAYGQPYEQHYDRTPYINPDDPNDVPF